MVPRSNSTMCQQIPKACKYSGTHLFKTSKATITTTQKRKKKEENGFGRRVVLVDGLIHMETGRKMSEKKVFSEKWSLTKGAVTRKYEEKGFRKRDFKQRWPFAKGSFSWKNPQEKGFRTRGSPLQRVHFHGRICRRKVSETGAALCKGFIFMEESAGERFQKQGQPFAKGSFSWKNPQEKGFGNRGSPLQRVHFHGRICRRNVSETGAALCKGFIFMEESAGERFQKQGQPFAKGSFSWKNPEEKGFRKGGFKREVVL